MKNRIKDNLFLIISLLILIGWGMYVVIEQYNYQKNMIQSNKEYLASCEDNCIDIFTHHLDTITSFFMNIGNTSLHLLAFAAPFFVIIPTVYYFYRKIKGVDIKSILVRKSYKNTMLKEYFSALKSTLIFPIFFVILFLLTYIQTGNFDIDYTFSHGGEGYTYVEEVNIRNYMIFIPVYIFVIWLHSIFWANIGVISVKKNKSVAVSVISAFIIYYLIFIIIEIFIGEWLFSGTSIQPYLGFGNIWLYNEVNYFGMIIVGFVLALLSSVAVFLTYKDKEKTVIECERR